MHAARRVAVALLLLTTLLLVACADDAAGHIVPVPSPVSPAPPVAPTPPLVSPAPATVSPSSPAGTPQRTVLPPTPTLAGTADIIPVIQFVSVRGTAPGGSASVAIRLSPSQEERQYAYYWPRDCDLRYRASDRIERDIGSQPVPDNGTVTWTWTLDPATPQGLGEVQVSCWMSRNTAPIRFG